MKITGLNELSKKLKQLADNAAKLDGTHTLGMQDVLTPSFMGRHTRFKTVDEFFDASGFKVDTQEEFEAIPEDELDTFVRTESHFPSWKELLQSAGTEWTKAQLGL